MVINIIKIFPAIGIARLGNGFNSVDRLTWFRNLTYVDLFAGSGCGPCDYWACSLADAPLTLIGIGEQTPLTEVKIFSAASHIRNFISAAPFVTPIGSRPVAPALPSVLFLSRESTISIISQVS
jgi:hypothetical protein